MKYKLLVLDLDDTLLNKEHSISEITYKTINKIRDMGVEVVIATGRMFASAMKFVNELKISTPVISYNGAYVKNPVTEKVIFHQPLRFEIAKKIIEEAEEKNLYINLYQDDKLYVAEKNQLSDLYVRISGVPAHSVGKLSKFISEDPTKLLVIENDRKKQQFWLDYFQEKYQPGIAVTESKRNYIEFIEKNVSKGEALEVVAAKLGFKMNEIVALGDGWNDLEMIKRAGLGVAMGNASAEIKEEAGMIAPPHDKEGAARILKDIFNLS